MIFAGVFMKNRVVGGMGSTFGPEILDDIHMIVRIVLYHLLHHQEGSGYVNGMLRMGVAVHEGVMLLAIANSEGLHLLGREVDHILVDNHMLLRDIAGTNGVVEDRKESARSLVGTEGEYSSLVHPVEPVEPVLFEGSDSNH